MLFDTAAIGFISRNSPPPAAHSMSAAEKRTCPMPRMTHERRRPPQSLHHRVDIVRYAAVDDVGRAVNPMILHGQTHGGIAQGAGQALLEDCHYDRETDRLGVRSGGEGGTTPALAAVTNAIVDAVSELGVRHIEMPATSERVWRAIRDSRCR